MLLLRAPLFSWLLVCESADLGRPLLWLEGEVGELCAVRYKLLLDGRGRMEGSDRLAIAFVVLSRANAAKVKIVPRFCFDELVESVDWWCLRLLTGRFERSFGVRAGEGESARMGED